MIKLSFGQQQRMQTLCQKNRKPRGFPQLKWDDLLQGNLATLDEIDLVILVEAIGSEVSRAMKRGQVELEQ